MTGEDTLIDCCAVHIKFVTVKINVGIAAVGIGETGYIRVSSQSDLRTLIKRQCDGFSFIGAVDGSLVGRSVFHRHIQRGNGINDNVAGCFLSAHGKGDITAIGVTCFLLIP